MHFNLRKAFLVIIGAIIIVVVLVILFISPIAKYLIEKYDVKYTGREITLDWAYVNPFTGYCYFHNVKFHEENSDSIFLSVAGLSGKFEMRKMFHGTYEISQLTLDHPWGNIIQTKKDFNFDSFIKHISGSDTTKNTTNEPSHFNILNIKIKEGEFHYLQQEIPVTYFIKGANFESDGKLWDADTVAFKFFFLSGPGSGSIEGHYVVNFKDLNYHYAIVVHHFDVTQVEQYLKAFANYGTFTASVDANMTATGNFKDAEDVTARGQLTISDFHIGKNHDDDYASFDKLMFAIEELSPKNKKYIFDSISLIHPAIKYEQYEHLDNLQMMFGEKGANIKAAQSDPEQFNLVIEIARYTKLLARNFFHSYYKINNLAITRADLKYNDYALSEKFSMAANPLDITADSIDKNHKRVGIYFKSGIKPYGNSSVTLSLNPKDTGDFDMEYHFQKIPVAMFNPYLISYTSFPLDRGTIELNGTWAVRKGNIQSENHLLVIDPRVTKRLKNKNTKWLPLPLIMSFIRDYGDVIDFEIPITGSLKNPKFHLHDVIFDILGNIFIKPPTTPYRMEVKNVENEIEKSLTLQWYMRQSTLRPEQEEFVNKMTDFLVKNPEASITVYPQQYAIKEKEYILFFEAKKKYFLSINHKDVHAFSEDDSDKVNKMSVKDSLFIRYVNKHIRDTALLFTMQDKCSKLIGSTVIDNRFKQLNKEREHAFISCFQKNRVESRVKIQAAENTIPYNGFSFYKIEYKGELPKSLTKAYQKIQELDDIGPRKKYEKERKKII